MTSSESETYRRQLEAVCENATVSLFIMDARQQCTYMNPAAEKMTGFTLAEVQGRPLHYFVHHRRPDGTPYPLEECPIDRALPQNNQEQGEDVFVHKDGRFYPVAFTASPLRENGVPVGTVIEVRDTTEEKRAAAEMRRAAERVIEAQQTLLAELSTPLIPIKKGIVVMPLIGAMNSERASQMLGALLRGVTSSGARVAIVDVTGVQTVDTHVADTLMRAARSLRLLGAEVIITGIKAGVAQVLVGLGADLGDVMTRRNLQDGVEYAESLAKGAPRPPGS